MFLVCVCVCVCVPTSGSSGYGNTEKNVHIRTHAQTNFGSSSEIFPFHSFSKMLVIVGKKRKKNEIIILKRIKVEKVK